MQYIHPDLCLYLVNSKMVLYRNVAPDHVTMSHNEVILKHLQIEIWFNFFLFLIYVMFKALSH